MSTFLVTHARDGQITTLFVIELHITTDKIIRLISIYKLILSNYLKLQITIQTLFRCKYTVCRYGGMAL